MQVPPLQTGVKQITIKFSEWRITRYHGNMKKCLILRESKVKESLTEDRTLEQSLEGGTEFYQPTKPV